MGCSPWGHKELGTTERITLTKPQEVLDVLMLKVESKLDKGPQCLDPTGPEMLLTRIQPSLATGIALEFYQLKSPTEISSDFLLLRVLLLMSTFAFHDHQQKNPEPPSPCQIQHCFPSLPESLNSARYSELSKSSYCTLSLWQHTCYSPL